MRGAVLVALACLLGAGIVAEAPSRDSSASDTVQARINLRATRQVIQGFGTSTRVWSDPHLAKSGNVNVPPEAQRQVLRAIQRLGLTRIRPVLDTGVQKEPNGPFDFSGKLGDAHAALVKQVRNYGIRTVFPGPVYLESWMRADDPGAYVDWAMAMIQRFEQDGVKLALYAPLNEPKVAGNFPPEWMHQVVLQLGRRLRAAGFQTKLVIPDDENPVDAYTRAAAVLSDPEARKYVAAVAFHIYDDVSRESLVKLRQLATKYHLPLWMTEYNSKDYTDWRGSLDWGVKIHYLLTLGGVNAIDYLFAYFGNWVGDTTLVRMDFDNGRYTGMGLTSLYWITGQYSHFVKPGDVRVAATPATGDVLVSAYRAPRKAIAVVINRSDTQKTTRVRVTGKVGPAVKPIRSSATEHWDALPSIPIRRGSFTATLPPLSVTTFLLSR